MDKEQNISDFFKTDYVNFGSYDNTRKISSFIDGLKTSARKILFTVDKNNINQPIKVSQLASKVALDTEYLHGEASLNGVIVNLARSFVGKNNIPFLTTKGSFGTRLDPVAAAPRYIKTSKNKIFDYIFIKDDFNILEEQIFEGTVIEPRYYMPIIPLALINGSEGLSSGFSQKILPRNPKQIIQYLKNKINNKPNDKNLLIPYYRDFKGTIYKEDNSVIVEGNFIKTTSTTLEITEIPVEYSLEKYEKVLQRLENKKIIFSYEDLSDPKSGTFKFNVKINKQFFIKYNTDLKIKNILNLRSSCTENFTTNDKNLKIKIFKDETELINEFFEIRKKYYEIRKEFILNKLKSQLKLLISKYTFIKNVITDKIILKNKKMPEIIKNIEQFEIIIKKNNSFDYLLNLPLSSISKERYTELKNEVLKIKEKIKILKGTPVLKIWESELDELNKQLKDI